MDAEVLKSYLVSLGFQVENRELNKFNNALRDASRIVESSTGGMVKTMLKVQTGIVAAFTGISTAILGYADHVAMADQQTRLFAMHMFMTKESARALQMVTDTLGASIDEIAWDPELHARAKDMLAHIKELNKQLGGTDAALKKIRDITQGDFGLFKIEMRYLGLEFVTKLVESFGFTLDDVHKKFREFIENFQQKIPEIAQELATNAKPILITTWELLKAIGEAIKGAATLFVNFVGLLSGDESLEGTELNFRKLAKAIQYVGQAFAWVAQSIAAFERLLIHLLSAITFALHGHWEQARDALGGAVGQIGLGSGILSGALAGAAAGSVIPGLGTLAGAAGGAVLGGIGGQLKQQWSPATEGAAASAAKMQDYSAVSGMPTNDIGSVGRDQKSIMGAAMQIAQKVSAKTGIDPNLIFAQMAFESGNFTSNIARTKFNLSGIRLPGSKEFQSFGSLDEYANRYAEVLNLKRYQGLKGIHDPKEYAFAAARAGYFGSDPGDNPVAYGKGMQMYQAEYQRLGGAALTAGGSSVAVDHSIDTVNVHVHVANNDASSQQLQAAVTKGIRDAQNRQSQSDIAQISPGI